MLKNFIQTSLLLIVLCTTATTYAQVSQAPDGIQFQALATDANGHPAAGRVIYVKNAIIAKTATGTIVYAETFKVTASSAGIFTIVLGKGTYASGVSSISNIDWSNGPFFLNLKIAVEPTIPTASWNVNNEYVDMGTSQFWSVPYALYAGNVKGADGKLNTSDTAAMLKPYFNAVNLKANIESPTFTGTVKGITKAMVGLANADNTSDIDKPVSTATQTALDVKANTTDVNTALNLKANTTDVTAALNLKANTTDVNTALALKEDKLNKSIDVTTDAASDTKYPSVKSVKTYVDAQVAGATIADANATVKGKIQLTGDLAGTAAAPTVPGLALKENLNNKSINVTTDAVSDTKYPSVKSVKTYVDAQVAGATIADATSSVKGKILLAGDLGGTATAPTVPGLTLKLDANQKGVANGVASLNAQGIIPSSQLPPVTLSSTSVVGSDAAMTALSSATVGSIAVRTDVNKNYVLSALPASTLGNWIELLTPAAPVQAVNGYTGSVNLTKTDLGLSNVNNTSDLNKPISTATQNALDLKANGATVDAALATKLSTSDATAALSLKANSADVTTALATKLSTADATAALALKANSADVTTALATKISNADATAALALKLDANKVAAANGVASLDALGKVPSDQIPAISFSSVKVLASEAEMLGLGSAVVGSVVIRTDESKNYVLAQADPAVRSNWIQLLTPAAPVQAVNGKTGTVSISATDLGLRNVENTSDANKPVSSATQTELDKKVDKVAGKNLSTNDYSTAEKNKLSAITGTNTGDQDLSSYATTAALNTKVEKETGKGLSTNDYSTAEKTKLAAITGTNTGDQDLSAYVTTAALNTKVDKETGKGLSTNDYSSAEKTKLAAITGTNTGDQDLSAYATNTNLALKAPTASPAFTGTVAIGTTNPSPSAVLDLTSTSKGLLLPRLTFAQKSAIVSPEPGLIFWCTDCGTTGEMQVYNGTAYVNMIGSPAQLGMPAIGSTTGMSSVTSSTASSGGVISSDGGATITARGVVWGTSTNPTISLSTKTTDGTGIGTFTSSLTGLTSGVTYYVRSYATNSVGTKYGSEISFNSLQSAPTLAATTAASSIGATTATSGGTISYNGGATVTVSGLVWSTSAEPTVALSTKTTNGTLTGTYTSAISGLTPGTLYYVRSYATNAVGTSYGAQTSFTTLTTPTLAATTAASSIASTTATSGGTITSNGGANITSSGVVYGTSPGSSTYSSTSGTSVGTFVSNLTGLTPATTYYVRAFATNSVGTVYGTEISFITLAVAPTLSTTAASSITKYAATSGGSITSNGGSVITASGICWSTTATPTISDSKTTGGTTTGTFTSSITGLTAGTVYYVKAYATNAIGTSYGAAQSFTTLATSSNNPVLASTTSATSITTTTAVLGGNVTDEGATQVSARGLVYGTSSGSSTSTLSLGSGAGTFTGTLTGLAQGTTYYVRSFATNAQGTSYGAETSFTTQTTPTLSATTTPTSITATSAVGGGTISSTGGATITTAGLVWDASPNPTITLTTKTTDGATSGTFTSSITGLTQGTTYHLRAYATNSVGTSYGPNITFTTLTTPTVSATATVTSITGTTATGGGTITSNGGANITSSGVVYGTSPGSSTYSSTSGTSVGTFVSNLTGLTPATTYYVRAFATNSVGTVYGTEVSFTTPSAPTISSTTSGTITSSSAILGGVLTSTGGATTSFGVIYSTSSTFASPITATINSNASAGTYTTTITGLSATTTYYVKAFATNTVGTTYGPTINFTTPVAPIAVGDSYGGGKVFYIFQPADQGYVANETHGLIAATVDQSTGIRWYNSNNGNQTTGATATAIGTGKSNTDKIINVQQGSLNWYAAGVAKDYKGGGYTDWYLPSRDELNLLYTQKVMVGGFSNAYYWTSTETSIGDAHFTIFFNGTNYPCCEGSQKYYYNSVRAIRKF